jgi:hypothetical protein
LDLAGGIDRHALCLADKRWQMSIGDMRQNTLPAYNVQTAVDAEYALIVAHAVILDAADSRCLQPMAKKALEVDRFQIVADAGYSNGEQAALCEAAGMLPHVPLCARLATKATALCSGVWIFATNPRPIPISAPEKRCCDARRSVEKNATSFMRLRLATAVHVC